ncbi:ABC transporter substrate-binding protein [Mesomycoplasma neurolyticum]|uniref:ABC-type oligopeptide transport system, periplasmic component n=1 Tax=Mesomycoplasma neurolyticum TaxID=2120 RepID=A0A449A4P2_9BACT|nr:ABC transporter substrate-binding protein [Mesomycoplasma neurolyticum]VEU59208.1 ABC-type oligopeptide transport system, periplasmic component [Mesomycoplasma neurolyticum]
MWKKKFKFRNFLLFLAFNSISLSAFLSIACENKEKTKNTENYNYDFGLVAPPINSLNYIKYESTSKVLPSLVEPFTKTGPIEDLKSILHPPKYIIRIANTSASVDEKGEKSSNFDIFYKKSKDEISKDWTKTISSSFYSAHDWELLGGLGRASQDSQETSSFYFFPNPKNPTNVMAYTAFLGEKNNFWSNGDVIEAKDLRDYFEYILDLNVGSQKKEKIRKLGIRSADEFIQAQNDYVSKFSTLYKNPWGRRKYIKNEFGDYIQDPDELVWQSQIKGDEEYVKKIKDAALRFGFYTGQLFLDYTNEEIENNLKYNPNFDLQNNNTQVFKILLPNKKGEKPEDFKIVKIIKNPYLNPYQEFVHDKKEHKIIAKQKIFANSENSFTLIYDENKTLRPFSVIHQTNSFFPVNRKFIEAEVGNIEKFGISYETFLTTGPFKLEKDLILGPNGYLKLTKNLDYFDASSTIPNKIKILFSTDVNVSNILFEDGVISHTYTSANKILKYYSDPKTREFLKKNGGYGTIAFSFNLDDETNKNIYLKDPNLRKAIQLLLNRTEAIKYVGWDFSLPTTLWTAYGQNTSDDGKNLETFYEGLKFKEKNNVERELLDINFLKHTGKSFNLEYTYLSDNMYDPKTAGYYLKEFQKNHPDVKEVKIEYLNNSTEEQKKAGLFLQEQVRKGLKEIGMNDFITFELKSLPENTYASFVDEGKFEIIYKNYDYLGGASPEDYIAVFFESDEINKMSQKNIGFKINPVGSFTYETYVADLFFEKLKINNKSITKQKILEPHIKAIEYFIEKNNFKNKVVEAQKQNSDSKYSSLSKDITNNLMSKISEILKYLESKDDLTSEQLEKLYTKDFLTYLVEYNILNRAEKNKIQSKVNKLFRIYILEKYGVKEIANRTRDTATRLMFEQFIESYDDDPNLKNTLNYWDKFVELAFKRQNEDSISYNSRIKSFFTSNFTDKEIEDGWETIWLYPFIGSYEKVIKDSAIVLPLMEVDTNWEISRITGVSSLYTYALQYAYDYTKPPRPGLPRKRKN